MLTLFLFLSIQKTEASRMVNSNLVSLFNKLSKKEVRKIRNWVNSPFFNQRQDVIDLFEYLVLASESPAYSLKKEAVFQAIFPNEKFEDSKIRYAMSFLLQSIKKYLAYSAMEKDSIQEQAYLCKALRELGHEKLFEKEWALANKNLNNQTHRNERFFYDNYLLFNEKYEYVSQQRRSGEMYLEETIQYLSTFFYTKILKQGCLATAHQKIASKKYDLTIPDSISTQITDKLEDLPTAVNIYYHSYQCQKDLNNELNFSKLKQFIAEQKDIFPPQELRDIYLSAINFSIAQLNNGKRFYIKEAFELYKDGLDRDLFLDNGYLSHFLYKNIIAIGLALGKTDWVKDFLKKYKKVLYPKNRENFYQYSLAHFYYRTKNYDKAMSILQKVNFLETLHNLDARRMLLCIYYELDEIEALHSHLHSFSIFIHRQKNELGYHSENFSNLISFVKKMLNTNLTIKSNREQLINEINNTQKLTERNWLLQQLGSSN